MWLELNVAKLGGGAVVYDQNQRLTFCSSPFWTAATRLKLDQNMKRYFYKPIIAFSALLLVACGGGGGSAGTTSFGSEPAFFTDSPTSVTLQVPSERTFVLSGGRVPYAATSSDVSVVSTSVSSNKVTFTAKKAGTANVKLGDAAGAAITVSVTVN